MNKRKVCSSRLQNSLISWRNSIHPELFKTTELNFPAAQARSCAGSVPGSGPGLPWPGPTNLDQASIAPAPGAGSHAQGHAPQPTGLLAGLNIWLQESGNSHCCDPPAAKFPNLWGALQAGWHSTAGWVRSTAPGLQTPNLKDTKIWRIHHSKQCCNGK